MDSTMRRKAHEATELAKLAVDLCSLSGSVGATPKDFLKEAFDLIITAGNLIEREERKKFEIHKEVADD